MPETATRLASYCVIGLQCIGSRAVAPGGARYSMPHFSGRAVFQDSRGFPQGAKLNSILFVTRSSSRIRAIVLFLLWPRMHEIWARASKKASIVGDSFRAGVLLCVMEEKTRLASPAA
jgi:hypothetical protein